MFKKIPAFLFFILLISVNCLQAQRFEWLKLYSSSSFSSSFNQAIEVSGNNVLVSGEFRGSISFGSTVLNAGTSNSIYVANYDTLGNLRWAVKGGANSNFEYLSDMKLDAQGNAYIIGLFTNSTSWGTLSLSTSGGTSSFSREGFIVKLNTQGVPQWIRGVYSPSSNFSFNGMVELSIADSTLFFSGVMTNTIAVTGSTTQLTQSASPFRNNIFVGRLDLNGNLKSLNRIASALGTNYVNIGDLEAIDDSSFYFATLLRGSYLFGSNNRSYTGSSTSFEILISKFTNNNCDWLTSSASTGFSSRPPQLDFLSNGDIYLTGTFSNSLQFQTKSISAPSTSFNQFWYAAKFNSSGTIQELEDYNVAGTNVLDIEHNSNNELFIVGSFRDSIDFNGQKVFSNGFDDMLVIALESDLSPLWFQTGGGGNTDNATAIASSGSPNVYMLGSFRGLSQFGTTYFTGSNSFSSSIVMKLSECGDTPVPLIFNGDTSLCLGESVRIVANPPSLSNFQWLKDSLLLAGEVYRDLLIDSAGAYQVIVNGAGCKDTSRVINVSVDTPPTVVYNLIDTVCEQNMPITLTGGSPSGGFYRGPGVDSTTFDPAIAGIGTHQIQYIFSNGGCEDSASSSIFVKPAPTVFFAALSNVCLSSSPITLTNAFPFGGSFSGPGVSGNQFNPAVAGGGIHSITYTYTDGNGCVGTASQNIEVDTVPTVSLSALPTLCENAGLYSFNEGSPTGGFYEGLGVSSNQFDPSVSGDGTFTIRYIISNQCDSDTATQQITVNPTPTVSLGTYSDVCEGSGLVTLSGGTPSGGSYSGTGVSGGQFDPSAAGVGTFSIYYDFTDAVGCSSRDSSSITVNALPTVSISNDTAICNGSSISLTAGGGTGYVWSTSATTASINVSPTATTNYYVTVTNANSCQQVDSVAVTVNPNPTASISGTSTICAGDNTTLTASGGTSYLWSNATTTAANTVSPMTSTTYTVTVSDANSCSSTTSQLVTVNQLPTVSLGAIADVCAGSGLVTLSGGTPTGGTYSGTGVSAGQFNPATAGVGTFTIYYDFTDAIGCSSRDSSIITVNALPTVSISNDTSICNGSNINLTAGGGTGYVWSTSATTASINVSPTATTNYYVTVSNANGCEQVDSVIVTVNPNPTTSISGTSTICEGDSTTLTATGGTSYAWSNSITTAVNTVSPTTTTTYTVTVTDANTCTATATQQVTVNPTPTVSLGSLSDVCEGSGLVSLSGGTPTGGTYSGTGVSGAQFDPSAAGVGIFTIYYDFSDAVGCSSRDSSTITVNALPTVSITNDTAICDGSSINLTAGGGTGYVWSTSGTTASINVSPTVTTTYYVTVTNSSSCQNVDSVTVTVNPKPTASISGTTTICAGDSTTLTASGGVSYIWDNSVNTAINKVGPTTNTTYSVIVSNSNGCSDTTSQLVTVNPTPTVSLGTLSDICEGSGLLSLSGGTPTGGTYSGTGVSGGQFDPSVAGVGTFTIYYDFSDAVGCRSRDSSSITVNALPTVSITNDTAICNGSSINLTAGGGIGYVWSNSASTAIINVNPTATTTYYVTVTNANSCEKVDSVVVDVFQQPILSVSNDTSICLGDTITISASSNFPNYDWSNSATTASTSVFPSNTTLYKVKSFNGTSCFAEDSILVTVNTGTPINIGPDTTLDAVTTTSFTYDAGAGFLSYLWQDNSINQTQTVNYLPSKGGGTDTISVIVGNTSGCPSVDTAIVFYDFNTGIIGSSEEESNIVVFPNPTSSQLNISFSENFSTSKQLMLYDMKGKVVLVQNIADYQQQVRLDFIKAKISKGVYLLNIEAGEELFQKKIIVQ